MQPEPVQMEILCLDAQYRLLYETRNTASLEKAIQAQVTREIQSHVNLFPHTVLDYIELIRKPRSGKLLRTYYLDQCDRIIWDGYAVFFLYREDGTRERVYSTSNGISAVLSVELERTERYVKTLSYVGNFGVHKHTILETVFFDDRTYPIRIEQEFRATDFSLLQTDRYEFCYEGQKLQSVIRKCENGYTEYEYTAKKPNFKQMKEQVVQTLKDALAQAGESCRTIGIEGFLDQQQPSVTVFATCQCPPPDYLADWEQELRSLQLFHCCFDDKQLQRCKTVIAEALIQLVQEGVLQDQSLYFRQNQVPVAEESAAVARLFLRANISVK